MTQLEELQAQLAAAQAAEAAKAVNKVFRPRITDVAYDVSFSLEDGVYTPELISISYKDGTKKDAQGHFIKIENPTTVTEGMRAWLMLKCGNTQFCQEYSKANGAGFQSIVEEGSDTILKTGAKITVFEGKVTYVGISGRIGVVGASGITLFSSAG